MTGASSLLVDDLVARGLERREACWLVEEFGPARDGELVLERAATRRLGGEPLQYVFGHWPFRTLDLDLDPRVLIPRPETEELVGVALAELARGVALTPLIMDLGCGSGAIGLSLLDELRTRGVQASLIAVDESDGALEVARRNARKHDLRAVSFVRSSWFDEVDPTLRGRVDLVVANPPYVSEAEFATLEPELAHEPRGALVAPDAGDHAGFADLAIIIAESPSWLTKEGPLVCEHADTQRTAVVGAASAAGFQTIEDLDDLTGRPRIMVARR